MEPEQPEEQPEEQPKEQPEEQPKEQPSDRMLERPDLGALREKIEHPSRARIRRERFVNALKNPTLWTAVLALAIIAVLVFGYFQLT